ncbi:MAG: DEAD/DEAH box helicase family protein, partial [Christensenellaceae bacterium]
MSKDYIKENTGDYPVYSSQTGNDGRLGLINSYDYDGEYLTWTTDGANAGTVEAFNQINRYQRDSFWAGCGLYEYVQIFVISNGTNTKYYSNSTRFNAIKDASSANAKKGKTSNSFEFTSFWADANNHVITDLIDFTKTFFAKHSILNVLTKYCIFTSESMLMVMRPYQITATECILNRIEIANNYKKYGSVEGGGYIWHTTGSGKTLTSFKTARLASQLPFIDKVLFVVDR